MSTAQNGQEKEKKNAVLGLRNLLESIMLSPEKFKKNKTILNALKSQGRIATTKSTYSKDGVECSTVPMSLNCLKKYSYELFDNGFQELNNLRLNALSCLEAELSRDGVKNKQSKAGLKLQVKDLTIESDLLRQSNYILLQALSQALYGVKSVRNASTDALRDKRAEEVITKLRAIVGVNPPPFNHLSKTAKIIDLKASKDDKN